MREDREDLVRVTRGLKDCCLIMDGGLLLFMAFICCYAEVSELHIRSPSNILTFRSSY